MQWCNPGVQEQRDAWSFAENENRIFIIFVRAFQPKLLPKLLKTASQQCCPTVRSPLWLEAMIFFSQHFQECFHNVFQVQRSSPHSCEILFAFHLFDPICLWKVRWWKWGVWRACLKVHSLGLISRLTAAICGSSSGFHCLGGRCVWRFDDFNIPTSCGWSLTIQPLSEQNGGTCNRIK